MRRTLLALFAFAACAAPLPGKASIQVDWVSRYIWRGFDLLPDNHSAIQPQVSLDLGKGGFSLDVWSSFALERRDEFGPSDEIDATLGYAAPLPEGWEMTVGIIHYGYWFADGFHFRDNTTLEVFLTLACPSLPLSPQISVYYDLNLGSGLYVTLGGSCELNVNEKVTVEAGGQIGFNSRQYIDTTGFSDIDLYVGLPLALDRLTLTPSFHAMFPLLDEVNDTTEVWLGFTAAF